MIDPAETGTVLQNGQDRTPRSALPDRFDELRQLLIGREQLELSRLAQRVENPLLRADDLGHVLPRAVLRCSKDHRFARAMAPTIETALHASIKRDPSPVANALYPVIGSAIRKAIADTFNRLIQSFNYALEHSFSVRGIRWRLEAW